MKIQRLFVYPVKSLLPVEISFAEVTSEGFRFDRQYILIKYLENESSEFSEHLTIKKTYALGLFQPSIHESWTRLSIRHTLAVPESSITIPLTPSPLFFAKSKTFTVNIFGTKAEGIDMGEEPAKFFSSHLGIPTRLLFIGGNGRREIPGLAFGASPTLTRPLNPEIVATPQYQKIRFADAAPFHITSSASEAIARSRLPPSCHSDDVILRFRPNIHISVGGDAPAFDEDEWAELSVYAGASTTPKALIRCIFKTARCLSLNADLKTGLTATRDQQLYGLLARDRRVSKEFPHKPVFGQYAYVVPNGVTFHVGDEVAVTRRVNSDPAV